MYILKNAFVSIKRNKGRSILMGIIIMVISCSCAVTLSIRNSANKIIDSYANKYEIVASISMNREKLRSNFEEGSEKQEENKEKFSSIENITVDQIKEYGQSNYVKSYYYTYSISMNSSNITKASSSDNNKGPFDRPNKEMSSGDFSILGYSSYDAMSDFIDGKYTIKTGEISDDFTSNSCIINSELASVNNLEVNDTITLTNPNDETKTYELKITGIYEESTESDENNMDMFTNSVNNIITNNTVIKNILKKNDDLNERITPTFVLKNKNVIDKFSKEVEKKGLSEYYQVTTNLDQVSSETESISNLSTFALTFLIVTLVIGGVVLFIINMINVRERKYEIGVLRTIGMKKTSVIGQFVIELLSVAIISLLIGCLIGSLISVPTANKLLENEVSSAQNDMQRINKNFGGNMNMEKPDDTNKSNNNSKVDVPTNGVSKINKVTKINAVVNFKILIQLLLIGLSLTLISSIAAMVNISRFSPLSILKERS